ncbi:aldose epimerase family protein [Aegicerativicinus sediminis]|uniref:aldose epimerase family protein n=1 Tax=Aegicerativicinus sediminis TaxID=2893202 RepID=UPI001E2F0F38|nr:aldose epimerase family protein [Aegicerativicinus sediminis]
MNKFNHLKGFMFSSVLVLTLLSCKNETKQEENNTETEPKPAHMIDKKTFGVMPDNSEISVYTLKNDNGMEVSVINYGGIITSLNVPDRNGNVEDIVLGFNNLEDYLKKPPYFGALIGRYGNRIGDAKFTLNGTEYQLAKNDGENSLHGGEKGFDKVFWNIEPITDSENPTLKLTYRSEDMEEGFPGNLDVEVHYILTNDNTLEVDYKATTDKPTVVNLTQHTYFNLSGDFSKSILDQEVSINADGYLPVSKTLIPTGEVRSVEGTPFDFRKSKSIGQDIEDKDQQISFGGGFDHCWVLNGDGMREAATAYDPASGRYMVVKTNEPAIQFYTGNFLDGTLPAKGGGNYEHRTGFCLETQHYPDSPNKPDFPSTELKPGEIYSSKTTFTFSTK